MNTKEVSAKMTNVYNNIMNFIDDDESLDQNFADLQGFFNDLKIKDSKYDLLLVFHLITKIANNHYHGPSFFDKIDKILKFFQDSIKNFFTNSEIFNTFKSNKRIILFLIEEGILIVDQHFIKRIFTQKYKNSKYPKYFLPEIKPFLNEPWFPKSDKIIKEINSELETNFYENRKRGENHSRIALLIQKDSVESFITLINSLNYSLNSKIDVSVFESNLKINHITNKKRLINPSLIEYAAFYGSFQIFQHLILSGVTMKPSLWLYAIHGKNPEIIHLLEDNHIIPDDKSYYQCFLQSVKCHHNDFANYFLNNFMNDQNTVKSKSMRDIIKYHNYEFIDLELIDKSFLDCLCKYDYPSIVDGLIKLDDSNELIFNNKTF